jgi:hypothetical protein
MDKVNVRYIVNDVDAAILFYSEMLCHMEWLLRRHRIASSFARLRRPFRLHRVGRNRIAPL